MGSDKTSARVGGKTWWQWVLLSSPASCHVIADTRAASVVSTFMASARPQVWVADVMEFLKVLLSFVDSTPPVDRLRVSNAYLTFSTAAGTSPRSVLLGVTANVDFCDRPDGILEHVIGCQPWVRCRRLLSVCGRED